jgi:hypothetical protein
MSALADVTEVMGLTPSKLARLRVEVEKRRQFERALSLLLPRAHHPLARNLTAGRRAHASPAVFYSEEEV